MVATSDRRSKKTQALDVGAKLRIVVVAGYPDHSTRSLERVLGKHDVHFIYHALPSDVLSAAESGWKPLPRGAHPRIVKYQEHQKLPSNAWVTPMRPFLFVVNFLSYLSSPSEGRKVPQRKHMAPIKAWLELVRTLSSEEPTLPILIAADEKRQRRTIESALEAGANEVIGEDEARIPHLVLRRVLSTLSNVEAGIASPAAGEIEGDEQRSEQDRGRSELREFHEWIASTLPPIEHAKSWAGRAEDVRTVSNSEVEADELWEKPLSEAEASTAMDRVTRELPSLPTVADRNKPFANVFGVVAPELRAESGRLDARRIAAKLDVSLRQLSVPAGVSHQALSAMPDSKTAQAGLDPIARVLTILDRLLPAEIVRGWLHTPHERLGHATPLKAILDGRGEKVARMLEIATEGGVG